MPFIWKKIYISNSHHVEFKPFVELTFEDFFLASSSYFAGCCPIDRPCRRQLSSLPHSTHSNTSESLRAINWSFRLKRIHFVSYFVLLYGQMWGDKTGVGKLGPVGHLHYTFTLPPPPRGPTGRQNTHRQEIMIVLKQFPNCTTMRNFTWIQTKRYPDLKKCHFQTSHRRTWYVPLRRLRLAKKKSFFLNRDKRADLIPLVLPNNNREEQEKNFRPERGKICRWKFECKPAWLETTDGR